MTTTKKNPWVAAILNFLLFGGGTVYVGKRTGVGVALIIGGTSAQVAEIVISPAVSNLAPNVWPMLLGGLVIMKLTLAVDGYREASAL